LGIKRSISHICSTVILVGVAGGFVVFFALIFGIIEDYWFAWGVSITLWCVGAVAGLLKKGITYFERRKASEEPDEK
jgi:hypothetical protein